MCYYPRVIVLLWGSFGQRGWRWVRTDSRGDARTWLGEAVIQTLNIVFWLYLTSYLAQEDARQLFECRTPSLVHIHHLVVCRPPTTEILTENRLQRGCWVATAGDCTYIEWMALFSGGGFDFWVWGQNDHRGGGKLSILTRAPLGYFYNAPHWGGGGYFEPPSDLRNYWTDSKNSSGIWKPWKNCWGKTNFIDLGVTSDVTGQVKVKMFDISGLVTSASKIAMLGTNKAN